MLPRSGEAVLSQVFIDRVVSVFWPLHTNSLSHIAASTAGALLLPLLSPRIRSNRLALLLICAAGLAPLTVCLVLAGISSSGSSSLWVDAFFLYFRSLLASPSLGIHWFIALEVVPGLEWVPVAVCALLSVLVVAYSSKAWSDFSAQKVVRLMQLAVISQPFLPAAVGIIPALCGLNPGARFSKIGFLGLLLSFVAVSMFRVSWELVYADRGGEINFLMGASLLFCVSTSLFVRESQRSQ